MNALAAWRSTEPALSDQVNALTGGEPEPGSAGTRYVTQRSVISFAYSVSNALTVSMDGCSLMALMTCGGAVRSLEDRS
jgi:hypothetical protein